MWVISSAAGVLGVCELTGEGAMCIQGGHAESVFAVWLAGGRCTRHVSSTRHRLRSSCRGVSDRGWVPVSLVSGFAPAKATSTWRSRQYITLTPPYSPPPFPSRNPSFPPQPSPPTATPSSHRNLPCFPSPSSPACSPSPRSHGPR